MACKFADLGIMMGAFLLAASFVTQGLSLQSFLAIRVRLVNVVLIGLLLLAWHVIFHVTGMYRSTRLASRQAEAVRVTQATTLGSLAILAAAALFSIRLVTPVFIGVFWATVTCLNIAHRLVRRALLARARHHGRNLRNVLIVGTNSRAFEFANKLEARQELGYRVMGFVDEDWSGIEEFKKTGRRLVTSPEELVSFLRTHVVDEVVIALPMGSGYQRCSRVVSICEEQGITVRFLSDLFRLKLAHATVEEFDDEPVITIWTGSMEGWPVLVKRLLDVALSSVLLGVLSPVLLLAALAVKLTSPGPVFYMQQRVGLNKRRFKVHKFRTMVVDAERRIGDLEHLNEASGPVFKIMHDPRVTPVGRFLRKTSIDELPQLFDVLTGDMSLVGPRPLPLRDYQGFAKDWHRRRFSVRPGITCLWQVCGRSSIPFDRWMELDMQYIDHWSLWLDLKILLQTIPAVLRGSGAA